MLYCFILGIILCVAIIVEIILFCFDIYHEVLLTYTLPTFFVAGVLLTIPICYWVFTKLIGYIVMLVGVLALV